MSTLPVLGVELALARSREMALTDEDVFVRRTRLTTRDASVGLTPSGLITPGMMPNEAGVAPRISPSASTGKGRSASTCSLAGPQLGDVAVRQVRAR